MEIKVEAEDYYPEQLEFINSFKFEDEGYKRIYSLKFKSRNKSEKWLELKYNCEHNQHGYDLFKNTLFRTNNIF